MMVAWRGWLNYIRIIALLCIDAYLDEKSDDFNYLHWLILAEIVSPTTTAFG